MNRVSFGKKTVLAAMMMAVQLAAGASAPNLECGRTIIPISEREMADWREMVTLFRYNRHTVKDIRYALYGAQEMYTPLDKIAQDLSALCDLIESTILQQDNNDKRERRIQKSIECLTPSDCESLTGRVIVDVFRKHRDTLKEYRQENEHRAVVSKLLDRVIHDVSIIDVLLASQ